MSRRFPWKNKPTEDDAHLIQHCTHPDAAAPTLFLLSEVGATQFILQSSSSTPTHPLKYRVLIGDTQRCSCADAKEGQRLCPHLIFVMLKVMRVSPSNPLLWQVALTQSEVSAIVKGRWEWKEARRRGRDVIDPPALTTPQPSGRVQRRGVEAEDVCAVCQEELQPVEGVQGALGLCWCDHGCGATLHARCMRVWAEHRAETSSAITCPVSLPSPPPFPSTHLHLLTPPPPCGLSCVPQMCRADWSQRSDFTLAELLQQLKLQEAAPSSSTSAPTPIPISKRRHKPPPPAAEGRRRCRGCKQAIAGHHPLYRCVHCDHHLCQPCFQRPPPRHPPSSLILIPPPPRLRQAGTGAEVGGQLAGT